MNSMGHLLCMNKATKGDSPRWLPLLPLAGHGLDFPTITGVEYSPATVMSPSDVTGTKSSVRTDFVPPLRRELMEGPSESSR